MAGALDFKYSPRPLPLLSLSCYGDSLPLLSLSFPKRKEGIPGSQKEPPLASGRVSCRALLESSSPGSLRRLNLMDWKVLSKSGGSPRVKLAGLEPSSSMGD